VVGLDQSLVRLCMPHRVEVNVKGLYTDNAHFAGLVSRVIMFALFPTPPYFTVWAGASRGGAAVPSPWYPMPVFINTFPAHVAGPAG
jgi:hypothetical protein